MALALQAWLICWRPQAPSIDDDHRATNTQLRAAMDKVESAGNDAPVEALLNALVLATQVGVGVGVGGCVLL